MIVEQLQGLAHPLKKLKLLPGNPRKGDVEAVKRSYERFGQRKPIVALPDGTVIAGNHQFLAAKALGWDEMAVVFVDDDDQTAKAFALADNRTSDLGTYDSEALAELLADVAIDPELLMATGYTQADLDALLGEIEELPPVIGDPDDVPESAPAKTIKGDVWLLGPHRLMCGDSTVPTDVERLMNGQKADMVWTDPPYGVSVNVVESAEEAKRLRRRTDGKVIQNDDLTPDQLRVFLQNSFACASDSCRPGAVWFVAAPGGPLLLQFALVLEEMGIWRQTITWVKDQFAMGRSDYHGRHEPIFYGWKPGAAHQPPPDRKQDTVWEFPRPKRSPEHPTMKPVDLIARAVENHTNPSGRVLDPFGGSGSTLIAAHGLGRIAHLMELDEQYCDVICKRWEQATGITPIHETTKREHSFLD
jgi:site-specific DNA-methyltransferase (adenine-specific)